MHEKDKKGKITRLQISINYISNIESETALSHHNFEHFFWPSQGGHWLQVGHGQGGQGDHWSGWVVHQYSQGPGCVVRQCPVQKCLSSQIVKWQSVTHSLTGQG